MSEEEDIINLLNVPSFGLFSEHKLYNKLIDAGYDITHNELKKLLNAQLFNQITKPQRRPKLFSSVYASKPFESTQMDIIDYSRYEINNYKYIFCFIDVYSRFGFAFPLTNHRTETILDCLKTIFEELGYPKNINSDLEFRTNLLDDYAKKNNIKFHYSNANEIIKNQIVERWNRTIQDLLQKYRISSGNYRWQTYLPDIIYNYNHTTHRTTKHTPYDIFNGLAKNEQKIIKLNNNFKVGDLVRIKIDKKLFDKGDLLSYSKDTYVIDEIKGNKIYLNGLKRTYQPHQLQSINSIIYKNNDAREEDEHVRFQKQKKQRRLLDEEDINEDDIITEKRTRKPKKRFDVEGY